ncbi:hypothetical protein [Streptomyces sp. NBC_01285]|uniref:hypothetical protein n=1 Tax=Streptomyces sp. NBC_01285 TaxID=2903813 RepID=UPI00225B7DC6|nr:hypothetical protein [Streptomyces sp. NBC_01285]MCX4768955.1 hypothetical protein [Streptomyces sp. NBC_01285]
MTWGIPMFGELLRVRGVGRALNYAVNRVRCRSAAGSGRTPRSTAVTEVARGGVQMTRAFTFELEGSVKPACVAESLPHFHP